jgi:hypothetical protein
MPWPSWRESTLSRSSVSCVGNAGCSGAPIDLDTWYIV